MGIADGDEGLGSFWISAPLFCPETVRQALDLPREYAAQALIAIGYPHPEASLPPRPEPDLAALVLEC
jgi:coenzyme F420-0:L-glutamate ligase/coenzyme F420-1:gamma-L-glutamate ligase